MNLEITIIKNVFKLFVTLVLVTLLVWFIDVRETANVLVKIKWYPLTLAVISVLGLHALNVLRWRYCLMQDLRHISYSYLLISYLTSMFVGAFLPTDYGGDALRVKDLWHFTRSKQAAVMSVALSRTTGLLATMLILLLFGALDFARLKALHMEWLFFLCVMILVLSAVLMAWRPLQGCSEEAQKQGWWWRFIQEALKLQQQLHEFISHRRFAWRVFTLAFCAQILMISNNFFYARAVSQPVSWIDMAFFIPIITIASILPISIGGIGLKESVYVLFFTTTGLTMEGALAIALINRLVLTAIIILGGILFPFRANLMSNHTVQ